MRGPERHTRPEGGADLPYLVWRLDGARTAATASAGGGLAMRAWIVNAQVARDYQRHDLDRHAAELASAAALPGSGVTMFTAADVRQCRDGSDGDVRAWATVGLSDPAWAAAPDDGILDEGARPKPGTINIVAWVPAALTDAALLNALCTATEAKSQALAERGIPGTGTPSDALTVTCLADGPAEPFCGPRSRWGARLARAVHAAVLAGISAGQDGSSESPTPSSPGSTTSA